MTHHTFTAPAILASGDERDVEVTYTYYAGYKGSLEESPEPESIEIQSVTPDVPDWDALLPECFEDYAGYLDGMAEWRAEQRHDY